MGRGVRQAEEVFQLRISLVGITPPIWRRIQVPTSYSFWDLHVAIQDAMGWLDYHLHEFIVADLRSRGLLHIGIPDEESVGERRILPGWMVPVEEHLRAGFPVAVYAYDFGDGWRHVVQLEALLPACKKQTYPLCLSGARNCPPEDCGGTGGYGLLLEALCDPTHPEHDSFLDWVGGSYDPEEFDPTAVVFEDPKVRWKIAFE